MTTLSPQNSQKLFIASVVMMIVAVTLSVFNTAQVLSAPLRTNVGVPSTVGFEGFLAQSTGQPIANGTYQLTFRVHDQLNAVKWTETHNTVQVTNGLYSVVLGSYFSFATDTFSGDRWIGVTVDTLSQTEISPRTKVSSVPFALNADNANKIGGGAVSIPGNPPTSSDVSMIALFDGACPSGWTNYTAAQGRVVVGMPTNGALGATKGTALADQGIRTVTDVPAHNHSFNWGPPGAPAIDMSYYSNPVYGDRRADQWSRNVIQTSNNYNGTNYVAHTNPVGTTGIGAVDVTMPYIQLRYCKLNP